MKKVLILCLHRPGRSPSQRFRFEQYLSFLEQNGYAFDFSFLIDEKGDKIFYKPGEYFKKMQIVLSSMIKRLTEMVNVGKYDLVFVQREAFMLGTAFFERTMAKKVPMIFDFDDSIWLQNISEANKSLGFLKDASKTLKIIEKAALVFAGNQYLADYAKQFNKKVVIVPTTIDTHYYQPKEKSANKEAVCIGWSGSFSTIEHFALAIPALKRVKEKYKDKVQFKVIGDSSYYCKELDTQGEPWIAATEVENLSQIDIGIMPLPDSEWAKGKCGLKGLQYMALGIPTLMSPVGINSTIIQHGVNGFLPKDEDEWVKYLSLLVEQEHLCQQIGTAGRKTVFDQYSVNAWKQKYLQFFNQLTEKSAAKEDRLPVGNL
jgi:glycosyltransferase involved in cell wall biosynthesis